jgi:hypothetical protein
MLGEPFPMNTHCPFSFGRIAESPDMALIMVAHAITASELPGTIVTTTRVATTVAEDVGVRGTVDGDGKLSAMTGKAGIVDGTAAVATTDKEPGAVTALMLTLGSATS